MTNNRLIKGILCLLILIVIVLQSCNKKDLTVYSPDGKIKINFLLYEKGIPTYSVLKNSKFVINQSKLGFDLKNGPLKDNFVITGYQDTLVDEIWKPVWGQFDKVRNNYNQLTVNLVDSRGIKLNIVFRAYNDGIAFRYDFPEQNELKSVEIKEELTQFKLVTNDTCWWYPADWNSDEYLYNKTLMSDIDTANAYLVDVNQGMVHIADKNAVNLPVTIKTSDNLYLSINDAALIDYASMTLHANAQTFTFNAALVPGADGIKVKRTLPFVTPWRMIQITNSPGELMLSQLIYNLNEPSKYTDLTYIKPQKYMGIWWELFMGVSNWSAKWGAHGANTENAKYYIDFASSNNISGLLIEGWNTGFDKWNEAQIEEAFDFTTPCPDFDINEVVKYGKSKNVELIGYHETGAAVTKYESRIDSAYMLYNKLGVHAVKVGYVGVVDIHNKRLKGEFHQSQAMVRHYLNVIQKAAKNKMMVIMHEPVKMTGLSRTYPNLMSTEAARGQEYNAFSKVGNPPSHLVTLPFTRMLAGPMDYTPGIFDIYFKNSANKNTTVMPEKRVHNTLCNQLALYVVFYSPIQMAADLPRNYENNAAFQFIRDVPTEWDTSLVTHAAIGEYVTVVRKEKGKDSWFIGGITNEASRDQRIKLDFLDDRKKYTAVIYSDASDADFNLNPTAFIISNKNVDSKTELDLKMKAGGGFAISIKSE